MTAERGIEFRAELMKPAFTAAIAISLMLSIVGRQGCRQSKYIYKERSPLFNGVSRVPCVPLCPLWLRSSAIARGKLIGVNILYGINTVTEALKARGRNFEWVGVAKERKDIRLRRVIDQCRKIGVPVRVLSREELDEIAGNAAHQGLVAATSAKQYSDLDDIVASWRALADRRAGWSRRSPQSGSDPAYRGRRRSGWRRDSRAPVGRGHGCGGEGFGGSERTPSGCQGHEHIARSRGIEGEGSVDRRVGRAGRANLRCG